MSLTFMNKKSGRAAFVLLLDGECRNLAPIALQAFHHHADLAGAPGFGFSPGPLLPRRIVTHVLPVPASETGDPVAFLVPLETDNRLLQCAPLKRGTTRRNRTRPSRSGY